MTAQARTAGMLGAAVAAVLVLGLPVMILLVLAPSSQAGCGASGTGPGPANVAGIPRRLLPVFNGAAQQFGLGNDGWAYLAALNYAESTFGSSQLPGVHSGSNSAGAAGPMQIGIGGAATDNWDTVLAQIPAGLPGGAQPPSVYDEADAVYAAAALLGRWGAPGDWPAALVAWNDYPPEIAQVTQLVAEYTHTSLGSAIPVALTSPSTASTPAGGPGCAPISGPTTPGAVAKIGADGTAAIPQGAPVPVQAAIAAGNRIIDTAYSQERTPRMLSSVQSSYDCSGATDFVLYNSGLSAPQVDVGDGTAGDSTLLESYGQPGPGQWVTVYASAGHAFIQVAGIVLDTAHYAPTSPGGSGPRWQPASILPGQLGDGNQWSQRHPPGL